MKHWTKRLYVEMMDRYILFHPAIESLKVKAEAAHQVLFSLYQAIGSLNLDEANNK